MPEPSPMPDVFVVWMHRAGVVTAVGGFADRDMAEAYAAYCNKRHPAKWFEVRSEVCSV